MTEQDFLAAGAECVGGDLILNRVVVGKYRHGQFLPSDEGLMMEAVPPAPTIDPAVPAPAPAPAAKALARKTKAAPAESPAPAAASVESADPLAALDDLPAA